MNLLFTILLLLLLVFYDCHKNRGIRAFDHPRLLFIIYRGGQKFSGMWMIVMRSGKGSTCKTCKKIFWEKTWRKLLTYLPIQRKPLCQIRTGFFVELHYAPLDRSHVIPIMLGLFSHHGEKSP